MAVTWISLPQAPLLLITKPKPSHSSLIIHNSAHPFISSPSLSSPLTPKLTIQFHKIQQTNKSQLWKLSAAPEESLPSDTAPIETAQEIVSTTDDGTGSVISILLFIAFVALFILTVGVIYLGVTDFLQKREKEKFEKEESAKVKKSRKKGKVRARAGPRGFGQKINEDADLDD